MHDASRLRSSLWTCPEGPILIDSIDSFLAYSARTIVDKVLCLFHPVRLQLHVLRRIPTHYLPVDEPASSDIEFPIGQSDTDTFS